MVKIEFTDDAVSDLDGFDTGVLKLILGKLRVLRTNPAAGRPLGRRNVTGDLTSFRALTVGNRAWRIVYRTNADEDVVCVVWVISGRSDAECYAEAVRRLEKLGDEPRAQALGAALGQLRPRTRRAVSGTLGEAPGEETS